MPPEVLRIAHLVENLNLGGLERFVLQLVGEQHRAGHTASVYCLQEPGVLAPAAARAGIGVTAFHKAPGLKPALIWRLARALRRDRVNVLHMHNPGVNHYGALAARLAGCGAVLNTRHGVCMSSGQPFNERYFHATMPFTGAVVCVSDDARRYFIGRGIVPPHKAHVILNGLDLEAFSNHQATPGAHSPRLRFGALGRMVPVKGHALLIQAFARLVHDGLPVELRIAGGGPLFPALSSQAAALGVAHCVSVQDAVDDVPGWLAGLDAFVFPSLNEGLPMVILEALAAGLPILSTRVGGVPEVAPEGSIAWFIEPGSVDALEAGLRQLVASPDLVTRGAAARRLAWERYGMAQTQLEYEQLYRRLLAH